MRPDAEVCWSSSGENKMTGRNEWAATRDRLVAAIVKLGFPAALGEQIAKELGSPKAMERMLSYLHYVKPRRVEMVVDEMLAIRSDIETWRAKKASELVNAKYNELLYYGFGGDDEDEDDDM